MVFEIAHWSAVAPLVAFGVVWMLKGRPPLDHGLFALACAASLIGEVAHLLTHGSWVATPWWPIVQFGLFAWSVSSAPGGLVVSLLMFAVAVLVASNPSLPVRTVPPRLVGAALVLLFLMAPTWWGREHHTLWLPVAVYCGLATLLWAPTQLYIEPRNDPMYALWWYPYQLTRLAAFGLFGWRAWRA